MFSIDKIKAAMVEVRKAQADYASWLANNSYLTNADYVKIVEKRDALVKYINRAVTIDQKSWSALEEINRQFYATEKNAISSGYGIVTSAELRLEAAETDFKASTQ